MTHFRYVKTYYASHAHYLDGKWFAPPRTEGVQELGTCRNLCLDGAHREGSGRCVAFVFAVDGCAHWPIADARGLTLARCFLYDGDNHGNDANMHVLQPTGSVQQFCACDDGDGCDVFERVESEHDVSGIMLAVCVMQLVLLCLIACATVRGWRCKREIIGSGSTALLAAASSSSTSDPRSTLPTPPPSPPPMSEPCDAKCTRMV